MATKSHWHDLVEELLVELSPRTDVADIVNRIDIEEFDGDDSCIASVNATTWIDNTGEVELEGSTVTAKNLGSTGVGEQRIAVTVQK